MKFGTYMQCVWELCVCKERYFILYLYGFEMDISERVHFKVLYFYILQHFTLTGGLAVIKEDVSGLGVHPYSQLFLIMCPLVILVKNTFILISDLKNDFLMI